MTNIPISEWIKCRWCGHYHNSECCPTVKAIEFGEDGTTIRRVEFRTRQDYERPDEQIKILERW